MRIAIAHTGKSKDVAQYLPNNFTVLGRTLDNSGTIIVGVDDHGWTLDQYVIPRLASGMIHCEEVIEINGLCITQMELNLQTYEKKYGKKGRKRALTDEQVAEVRDAYKANDLAWQQYRSNPSHHDQPFDLSCGDLAVRFRVSEGVIRNVLDRKGAYKQ